MTTSAILVALAVVFSLLLYFIPFFQFALFLIGIPIIIIGKVADIKVQLLAAAVVIIILTFLDPMFALSIGLLVMPLAIAQGYMLKIQAKTSYIIGIGALCMVFGFLGFFYGLDFLYQIDFMADLQSMIDLTVDQMKIAYGSMSLPADDLQVLYGVLEQMRVVTLILLPSMLMIYSLVTSAVSYALSKLILKRLGYNVKESYFKDFRIDKQGRLILMVVLGMIILMTLIDEAGSTFYVSNFMSIFNIILQINALGFIWFLLEKHPNKKMMKIGVVALYILGPIIPGLIIIRYILSILGFADLYVDFRAKINSRSE